MDDLVQWLRAQLDEDERIARAAAAVRGPVWWYEGYLTDLDGQVLAGEVLDGGGSAVRSLAMTTQSDAEGEHAARHDPDRVLREIDAKRQIIALHRPVQRRSAGSGGGIVEDCQICGHFQAQYPCPTLRLLVLPYANRPGYRDEWRP